MLLEVARRRLCVGVGNSRGIDRCDHHEWDQRRERWGGGVALVACPCQWDRWYVRFSRPAGSSRLGGGRVAGQVVEARESLLAVGSEVQQPCTAR